MEDLTFGEQVKIILGRKGMTIKELAEIIEQRTGKKMSRQNLTQRLGRDNFQEQDMRMIADILGCPFHLSILTNEVQADSAGAVQAILADRAQKSEKRQRREQTVRKAHTVKEQPRVKESEKTKEAEPYQMSLFEDAAIQAITGGRKDDADQIESQLEDVNESAPVGTVPVQPDAVQEVETAEQPQEAAQTADTYKTVTSYEDEQPYTEEYEEDLTEEYGSEASYPDADEEELELIPEDAEEVDMTIGELYDIHEGLTELEKSVEAGESVESIKEELEKPVEQIKPKKERFRTGGMFLRKIGLNTKSARETAVKTEPVREEPVREESVSEEPIGEAMVRTSFTETVPVREEPRRTEPLPDPDDFEPVIKYDDVEEDREQGEINPYTGREFQSNSVRMHPNRIGYVQVYDRKLHKWTDMTEWAFLGYQERKKALLGKDYEPPIYLD